MFMFTDARRALHSSCTTNNKPAVAAQLRVREYLEEAQQHITSMFLCIYSILNPDLV